MSDRVLDQKGAGDSGAHATPAKRVVVNYPKNLDLIGTHSVVCPRRIYGEIGVCATRSITVPTGRMRPYNKFGFKRPG